MVSLDCYGKGVLAGMSVMFCFPAVLQQRNDVEKVSRDMMKTLIAHLLGVLTGSILLVGSATAQEVLPWEQSKTAPSTYGTQGRVTPGTPNQRTAESTDSESRAPWPKRQAISDEYGRPYSGGGAAPDRQYSPPPRSYSEPSKPRYAPPPRRYSNQQTPPPYGRRPHHDRTYSRNEIVATGHKFFGSVSKGMAKAVEYVFKRSGRPNGYILGEDAGGAIVAGLRYGEGTLYTKNVGAYRVYWQGPTIGYDFGAEGSKVMILVYNMRRPGDIYRRFGGVQGSAYLVGGVGVQLMQRRHITIAPIRAGVGLRFGANVGYLKFTRRPTWNPF